MNNFSYQNNALHAEAINLEAIAKQWGTPCYVYSRSAIETAYKLYSSALAKQDHQILYSVKANSNLAILNILFRLGCGFDIVSGGELERCLAAGAPANRIVFSGVGKSRDELKRALEVAIGCINVESASELQLIAELAKELAIQAPISLRVNPDVDAKTHPHISTGLHEHKFGIPIEQALNLYRSANKLDGIKIIGVDCHIGSQLTELAPFNDALERMLTFIATLRNENIPLRHLNLGGGLGINYHNQTVPSITEFCHSLTNTLSKHQPIKLLLEPGRSIVGNAGVLLTSVLHLKHNQQQHFAIVDAAMNDLLRPALYDAWHDILPIRTANHGQPIRCYDVVGPVCETADTIGKNRELAIASGDVLAVMSAGAYGFVMSSNYNSRPKAPEVMVDNNKTYLIRPRETITELFANEVILTS